MIKRLFVCMTVLGCLLLLSGPIVWATTYPNNYTANHSYSYDPTVGNAGTLRVTISITGSMQIPSCPSQYLHTPSIDIKLPNGNMAGRVYGTPTGACNNMTFSHTFTFDLESSGCLLVQSGAGPCLFVEEPEISCPIMGVFWWPWMNIQFEEAETHSVISALLKADGFHPQAPYCSIPSSPADLEPATEAQAQIPAGQYVETAFMWREIPWGSTNFNGVTWHRAVPINPEHIETPTFEAPDCTNWDKHYRGIPPVYTP